MGKSQIRFGRTSTQGVWCISIPTWRITKVEAVFLRCRIERMKSFDFIRMELTEDAYEYHGYYEFISAKNVQNMMTRVNMIILDIQHGNAENSPKKILDLSLTYHWYDEIAAGRKKEEYRKRSGYYYKRLTTQGVLDLFDGRFKHYDAMRFHRGQGSRTTMQVECLGIHIGYGKEEWGAPKEKVFIITLGNILEKSDDGQITK